MLYESWQKVLFKTEERCSEDVMRDNIVLNLPWRMIVVLCSVWRWTIQIIKKDVRTKYWTGFIVHLLTLEDMAIVELDMTAKIFPRVMNEDKRVVHVVTL